MALIVELLLESSVMKGIVKPAEILSRLWVANAYMYKRLIESEDWRS